MTQLSQSDTSKNIQTTGRYGCSAEWNQAECFLRKIIAEFETMKMEAGNFNIGTGLNFRGFVGDRYIIDLDIEPRHHNVMGFVHGGVICTLLDTVMARSFFYSLPEDNRAGVTLEIKVNFLKSTTAGKITAFGKLINKTKQIAFVEGHIENEQGQLVAKASATMVHIRKRNS